jgi:hypothetical protein
MVRNVYVYVFANGNKIYGRYFGADDLGNTEQDEYWTVENVGPNNTPSKTTGTLHMSVPSVSAEAEIVLIANIDLDFLNISEERLGLVRTREELQELVVSLNQEIPDRNAGYFMMTGSQTEVTISSQGVISVPNTPIKLRRLDAKVEVNVRVNPNEGSISQKVKQFIPESWEVINLPKSSYLVPNNDALQLSAESYYNIKPKNFETTKQRKSDCFGMRFSENTPSNSVGNIPLAATLWISTVMLQNWWWSLTVPSTANPLNWRKTVSERHTWNPWGCRFFDSAIWMY